MKLQTASQVIHFTLQLEESMAKFYELLAKHYTEYEQIFSFFATGSRKNKLWVQRAYHEVVSDALETGFSFDGLDVDVRLIDINLTEGDTLFDSAKTALDAEERVQKFYQDVARQSTSFLADVPRAFERVANKKEEIKEKLKTILQDGKR